MLTFKRTITTLTCLLITDYLSICMRSEKTDRVTATGNSSAVSLKTRRRVARFRTPVFMSCTHETNETKSRPWMNVSFWYGWMLSSGRVFIGKCMNELVNEAPFKIHDFKNDCPTTSLWVFWVRPFALIIVRFQVLLSALGLAGISTKDGCT